MTIRRAQSLHGFGSGSVLIQTALLVIILALSIIDLTGCAPAPSDPREHHIVLCDACGSWQHQLGSTKDKLSEEEQQLIENYVKRIQYQTHEPSDETRKLINNLVKKYNVGTDITKAPHEFLVSKAIVEQRRYEELHPFNPTGKPLTLAEHYPITVVSLPPITPIAAIAPTENNSSPSEPSLTNRPDKSVSEPLAESALAAQTPDDYHPEQRWQLSLLNLGDSDIKTFKGTLKLQLSANDTSLTASPISSDASFPTISVPLTQFVPPVPPNKTGGFVAIIPQDLANKLAPAQLRNPKDIKIVIKSGEIVLTSGEVVAFR